MDTNESLLRAIFMMSGRSVFLPNDICRIVAPRNSGDKNFQAYNLCDGNTSQAEIAKKTKLDKGQLSRSLSNWIEAGIVVRVGAEQFPLHVYPLTKENLKRAKG